MFEGKSINEVKWDIPSYVKTKEKSHEWAKPLLTKCSVESKPNWMPVSFACGYMSTHPLDKLESMNYPVILLQNKGRSILLERRRTQ